MQIFTIVKVAVEKDGPAVLATTEKAFKEVESATAHLKTVPILWDEVINGMECTCERAVHPVILE